MSENLIKKDITEVFSTAFLNYAGYNIQRRAIPDVRDGLKWGARQLLYSQMLGGFTYNKPFKKAIKSVSQAMGFCYVHGDTSAYGTFIRMAKPFSYRYMLQEASGNYGTLINPDDHSASRYVELRGSKIADLALQDIKKETIDEWEDTYDLEGQFPKVLPSKGIWLGVNGCISISSGMACSIPPTNLKEVNEALIKLINNPNIPVEDIICMPDFPTGGIILNASEVKESMKNGHGFACKIRAIVEYDKNERCFIVKEMPYSTFTNTICNELAALMEEEDNCGIKDFKDYTGIKPDLRIYLTKNANPDKVLRNLYKKTSLQTHYSINMVMLDKGLTPKIFGWKEALQAHINHEKNIYYKGFLFDLNKIKARIHIINGLLICLAQIEEVVQTIKKSSSVASASAALQEKFLLDSVQAKAVLDMKLNRLAHLEVQKLEKEKINLENEANKIQSILDDEQLFNQQLINGWKNVMNKFGDARRTQIMDIEKDDEEEPREIKNLSINLTNKNNLIVNETSSLYIQRRGGVGTKFKLDKDEYIVSSITAKNNDTILFFTKGIDSNCCCYKLSGTELPIEVKTPLEVLLNLRQYEKVIALTNFNKKQSKKYIIFVTKKGYIKKSELSEYNTKRSGALKALELYDHDELCAVSFVDDEEIGIVTENGRFLICRTDDIRATGRVTKGVHGIKLDDGDGVSCVRIIPKDTKEIISITSKGYTKRTHSNEFTTATRNTKGQIIQKIKDESDYICDLLPITSEGQIIIVSSGAQLKIKVDTIPLLSKNTQGVRCIKLKEKDKVIGIFK